MRLLYSYGRSPWGIRHFYDSAQLCYDGIRGLVSLGHTVAEIRYVESVYLARTDQPIGPHLAERLASARARVNARIGELEELRRRLSIPARVACPGRR